MSVPDALRAAEILSQGRLVVLPSAKKSAEDVPIECQSGTRCFRLLMRLTQLWMPAYVNGGDADARKVFTPNTYSSRESNILQGTKELIRCRTFLQGAGDADAQAPVHRCEAEYRADVAHLRMHSGRGKDCSRLVWGTSAHPLNLWVRDERRGTANSSFGHLKPRQRLKTYDKTHQTQTQQALQRLTYCDLRPLFLVLMMFFVK